MAKGSCTAKLVVIFFIAASIVIESNAQNSCTAPSVCVPIGSCPHIIKSLWTPSPTLIEFVQRLHCGDLNGIYHVCCYTASSPRRREVRIRQSGVRSFIDIWNGMSRLNSTDCGVSTKLTQYPWMALLIFSNGTHKTMDCTGSLITDRYVLTAAHCILSVETKLVGVRLGAHDIAKPEHCIGSRKSKQCVQDVSIEEAIYHHDFNKLKMANDIGLLRLASKVKLSENISPICLPLMPSLQDTEPILMRIAGWRIRDHGTCFGDSGGPMFARTIVHRRMRYVLYGVILGGSTECGHKFPSLYANVPPYLHWIAGNLSP